MRDPVSLKCYSTWFPHFVWLQARTVESVDHEDKAIASWALSSTSMPIDIREGLDSSTMRRHWFDISVSTGDLVDVQGE